MLELQRFVWGWPGLVERFGALNPALGARLERSTRPIAAERRPDGRLLLVLGCWVPADRTFLSAPDVVEMLERGLARLMDEKFDILVTHWPAGDGLPDQAPDPLAGLSEDEHAVGIACGGAIHRSFFAAAVRRGIVFECQVPVLHYRLDFAQPRLHLGVQIGGWQWRNWTRPNAVGRREREQELGSEGWTVLWFTGQEILDHLDQSIDEVVRVAAQHRSGRPNWGMS